jgi:hypothetical protein
MSWSLKQFRQRVFEVETLPLYAHREHRLNGSQSLTSVAFVREQRQRAQEAALRRSAEAVRAFVRCHLVSPTREQHHHDVLSDRCADWIAVERMQVLPMPEQEATHLR